MQRTRIAVSFGGSQATSPAGVEQSGTLFNYLVGDASEHRSNVPGFDKIRYADLYPGTDLLTWAQPNGMKYEFHVAPGADWSDIRVNYAGSLGMSIAADGSLHIATALGDLVEQPPMIYQMVNGNRVTVAGRFVLVDSDTYAFDLTGTYDTSRELVIDPNLAWSSYLPTELTEAQGVAVDSLGNVYATGYSTNAGWATPGAYDTTLKSFDAFVAKFDPSGSRLLYATFFGGSSSEHGYAIAVDAVGDAYVTGMTASNGVATPGAYQTQNAGGGDAFVAKFDPTGSSLLYATYLGGSGLEYGYGIAIDSAGDAYIAGTTQSSGWATPGAYNETFLGGTHAEAYVAKINPSGSSLLYATYLGGSNGDNGRGIAVDAAGNAYVTGYTASPGWATVGSYDTELSGLSDAFAAKLDASGANLLYATYLGGSGTETGEAIAIDRSGNAYISGQTGSAGWATAGAYGQSVTGANGFVAELNSSGSSLIYATYVKGSECAAIAVDGIGNVYVTGYTTTAGGSTDGSTPLGSLDVFVDKISPGGSSLVFGTYLGGSGADSGLGLAIDASGNVYVGGRTASAGSATPGAFDTVRPSSGGPFVLKISGLVDLYPGDTNEDGAVNFADLVAVAQNYGGAEKGRGQGDVTGDGMVGFADLVMVAQNYGANVFVPAAVTSPPPVLGTAVTEVADQPSASPPAMAGVTPAAAAPGVGMSGAAMRPVPPVPPTQPNRVSRAQYTFTIPPKLRGEGVFSTRQRVAPIWD